MITKHMAHFGRVLVFGSISNYNDTEKHKYTIVMKTYCQFQTKFLF
jgi:NADPH-dependent curcumin reductase CurA